MSFFGKVKGRIGSGFSKIKQISLFHKKSQQTQEDPQVQITDVDITIARLKTQKRKINEQLRKVRNESTIGFRQK